MTEYVNEKLCSECGGYCCKTCPGACFPSDFDNDKSIIISALKTGKFCIDWWEGDPRDDKDEYYRAYFIRPSVSGMEGNLFDATWGGVCTFLKESGCSLSFDERPLNCRMLIPTKDDGDSLCEINNKYTKQASAISWLPFYNFLEKMQCTNSTQPGPQNQNRSKPVSA